MNNEELPEMVIEDATGDFAMKGEKIIWPWVKSGFVHRIRVFRLWDDVFPNGRKDLAGQVVISDDRLLTVEEARRHRDALSAAIEIAEKMQQEGNL